MPIPFDAVDRVMVQRLERNARLSLTDLALATGSAASECERRLARLEQDGHILGYQIIRGYPDPEDQPVSAAIHVRLDPSRDGADFWRSLEAMPEVSTAESLQSDGSILLRTLTATEAQLQALLDRLRRQTSVASVEASRTSLVTRH